MHWEKLKNKRTRIQIRKAQNRGCCGNHSRLQTGAKPLKSAGAAACQAQLPLPPRLPPPAQCRAHGHRKRERQGHGEAPLLHQVGPAWAPTTSCGEIIPLQSDTSTQRPAEVHQAPPVPPPRTQPHPSAAWADTAPLCVEMPSASATNLETNMQARDRVGGPPQLE